MARIIGVDGMTVQEVYREVERGTRFVRYQSCVSVLILSFRIPSDIYLIRGGESAALHGLAYCLLALILGWWGIPWGPIYTIESLLINLGGGRDVTAEVLSAIRRPIA